MPNGQKRRQDFREAKNGYKEQYPEEKEGDHTQAAGRIRWTIVHDTNFKWIKYLNTKEWDRYINIICKTDLGVTGKR